jgi:hypothetical protein
MPAENTTIEARWLKLVVGSQESDIIFELEGLLESINSSLFENKEVEVKLLIETKETTEITSSNLELFNSVTNRNQNIVILDIRIIISEQGKDDIIINQLNQNVSLIILIPEVNRGFKNYQIIRIHEGEIEFLDSEYDEENNTISFETDRFSNYAIIYDTNNNLLWWLLLLILIPTSYILYRKKQLIFGFFKKSNDEEDNKQD